MHNTTVQPSSIRASFVAMTAVFFWFVVASTSLLAQNAGTRPWHNFPPLQEVAEHIVDHFGWRDANYPTDEIELRKEPTGWTIVLRRSGIVDGPYLVWSSKSGQYATETTIPTLVRNPSERGSQLEELNQSGWDYRQNLFAGYATASDDVIAMLSPLQDLSSEELNHLGRAYDDKGSRRMHARMGFAMPHPYDAAWDIHVFKPNDFDDFDTCFAQGRRCFLRLRDADPDFELIVGNPAIKLANDAMAHWMEYDMIGLQARAAKFAELASYPPEILENAEMLLASCPPNAILFVNGDNDTYPLLWLQQLRHIRSDVAVVNVSMLNDRRYLRYCGTLWPQNIRLDFGISMETLLANQEFYFAPAYMQEGDLLHSILQFQGKHSALKVDDQALWWMPQNIKRMRPASMPSLKLALHDSDPQYLLLGELATLGIINANFQVRPVCFSMTVARASFLGLQTNFSIRGLVYELMAQPQPPLSTDPYRTGRMNRVATTDLLLHQFTYAAWTALKGKPHCADPTHDNLRSALFICLLENTEAHEKNTIQALLDLYKQVFDPAADGLQFFDVEVARIAWEHGRRELAKAIMDRGVKETQQNIALHEQKALQKWPATQTYCFLRFFPEVFRLADRESDALQFEEWFKRYADQIQAAQ